MSTNKNYFDLIDSYLNGEMNQGQALGFERQLQKDPLLENEFQLQKDVINSLKNYRRAELKAALDAVEIGGGAFSAFKIAAGIGILVLIGAGYYYMGGSNDIDPAKNNDVAVESPLVTSGNEQSASNDITDNAIEKDKNKNIESDKNLKTVVADEQDEKTTVELSETAKQAENKPLAKSSTEPSNKEKLAEKTEAPNITLPDVVEDFEEDNEIQVSENIKVPVNKMQQATDTYIPKTEVVEMDNGKYVFHYQFYNNKLYLFGDFDNKYEILELNTPDGISIYLFYNDKFYELQQNQEKIRLLEPIQDESLIEDLKTIKEN